MPMAKRTWKRKLTRLFLRLMLYVGLPVGLLLAFIHTPLVKSLVFDALSRYALKKYSLQLTVRSWDYSLLTGWVKARDLTVSTPQGAFFCRVPAVDFRFSTMQLVRGELLPQSLRLDGVQLVLTLPSEELKLQSEDSGPVDIHFRRIAVRRGTLRIKDLEIPLDFDAGRFDWVLTRSGADPNYGLDLSLRDAILRQGTGQFAIDRLQVTGDWTPSHVLLHDIQLDSPLLAWRGSGGVATTGTGRYHVDGKGRIHLARLRDVLPALPVELSGDVGVGMLLAGEGGSPPLLSGTVQGEEVYVNRQRIRSLSAKLSMSGPDYACDDLHVEVDPDGTLSGRLTVSMAEKRVRFSAQMMDFALAVFRTGRFFEHPLDGLVEGTVEGEVPFSGPPSVRWDGQVADLRVLLPNGRDYYRGEFIRGRVALERETLRFEVDQALGEGVLVDGAGRVAGGELWLDRLHVQVPIQEEARDLIERVARLSPGLLEKLEDMTIRGQTEFTGRLHLKGSFPEVSGTLSARDIALAGVGWDEVRLPFDLGRSRLQLRDALLRRGQSRVDMDLDLRLEPGTHLDAIDARVQDMDWAKVEKTLNFVGVDFGDVHPARLVSADISGRLRLALPEGGPWEGEWALTADHLYHKGVEFGRLTVGGRLDGRTVRLEQVALQGEQGEVTGRGEWDTESDRIGGSGEIRRLSLDRIDETKNAGLQGTFEGTYRLQGTLARPDLQVDARSSKIAFQGESFGDLQLKGRLIGETVSYNLRAVFRRNLYHALGTLTLGEHPVLESTLLLDGVKIRPFLRQFHFPLAREIQGTVKGEIIVVYPFDQPEKLEVDARLQEFGVQFRHLDLKSTQTIYVKVANRRLSLDGATLLLNGDPVAIRGSLGVFPLSKLQVDLQGAIRADLLEPFYPDLHPGGKLIIQSAIQGDPANPTLSGRAELKDASLKIRSPELTLSKINGVFELSSRSIRAERVTVDTPYGPAALSGECLLKNLEPARWSANLSANRLYIPYPKGFISQVSTSLRFQGQSGGQSLLSGDVWIDKSAPATELDLPGFAAMVSSLGIGGEGGGGATLPGLVLNLNVKGDRSIQIESKAMEITGSIDLQITGSIEEPAIRGSLLVNNGELKFKVNRFQVDRGVVSFVNPSRIDPEINLQLSCNIKDYQVMITLEGAVSRLRTRFSSIPSLPTVDVVRLITTGELPSGYSHTSPEYRTADTTGLLSQMLSETVRERLGRVIGVDTFSVDTSGVGAEASGKTRVTVGEQVSRDLFVTYSKSFSSEEEDLIFIEYRLSPRVTVMASRDEKGYFGLDIRFRRKIR